MRDNKIQMRNFFLLLLVTAVSGATALGQRSSRYSDSCDYIYLKSKKIYRGTILDFEQSDGDITFQDEYGRFYSWSGLDYEFFEYDRPCRLHRRKAHANLNDTAGRYARKETGFLTQIGPSLAYVNVQQDLVGDDYFLNGTDSWANIPFGLKLSLGSYINPRLVAGVTADLWLMAESER